MTSFQLRLTCAKQFGASRSVLREAVKLLTAKGLIGSRPRQGTRIEPESNWNLLDPDILGWLLERKLDIDLLEEFTEIRLAVEPLAAALAAKRAKDSDILLLQSSLERMQAAERGDDDPYEIGYRFSCRCSYSQQEQITRTITRDGQYCTTFQHPINQPDKRNKFRKCRSSRGSCQRNIAGKPKAAAKAMTIIIDEVMEVVQTYKETNC